MEEIKHNDVTVSIICPVYNKAEYIQQGMDSILAQKVDFSYEILIGEDCSTDNSYEILKEYEEKYPEIIHIFRREKNLRQSKNVYDLFKRSKGKYIMILDLDDYWTTEDKLLKQVQFLEGHPEYIGVVHDFVVVDKYGIPLENKKEERKITEYLGKEIHLDDFLEYGFIFQTATLCYRNIWREDWDYSVLYEADDTVVDLTINTMLLKRTPIFALEECMSAYRLVIEEDAKNVRSVCSKDLAKDYEQTIHHLRVLNKYFNKEVDFSCKWAWLIEAYLQGVLRREDKRFRLTKLIAIYTKADRRARHRFHREIFRKVKRKLGK